MRRPNPFIVLLISASAAFAGPTIITIVPPEPAVIKVTGSDPQAVTVIAPGPTATITIPGSQGPQGLPGPAGPQGIPGTAGASSWDDITDKPDVAIKHQPATFAGTSSLRTAKQITFGNTAMESHYLHGDDGDNIFLGRGAGEDCIATQGDYNCTGNYGLGTLALRNILYGSDNVAIGLNAGAKLIGSGPLNDAHDNVLIGFSTDTQGVNDSDTIVLGTEAVGKGPHTTVIGRPSVTNAYIFGNLSTGTIKADLPANRAIYTPYTSTRVWTNVQQAITETNRIIPEACVNVFDGAESIVPGPPGPAGQIISVMAETLVPGSSATIQNLGSFSLAELVFGIPRGDKGDPGAGVPPGGISHQHLMKVDGTDYNVHWDTPEHFSNYSNPHNVTAAQTGAEPAAGNPSVNGYCWTSLTNGTRSWGACGTGGGGTPGGANKSIQYNNAGSFGGFGRYSSGCLIL